MRAFHLIISLLCLVSCAFCAGSTQNRFEKYQSQSRLGPIDLDDSLYEDITSEPRDYHVVVLLTATEARFGCILCREFQPDWELIARSWNKGSLPGSPKMLFGSLDFNDGKSTFQKVWITHSCYLGCSLLTKEAHAPNGSRRPFISSNRWLICEG